MSTIAETKAEFALFGGKEQVATSLVQLIEDQHLIESGSSKQPFLAIESLGRWQFQDCLSSRKIDLETILPTREETKLTRDVLNIIRLQLIDILSPAS